MSTASWQTLAGIVLLGVGAVSWIGPQLSTWLRKSIDSGKNEDDIAIPPDAEETADPFETAFMARAHMIIQASGNAPAHLVVAYLADCLTEIEVLRAENDRLAEVSANEL